MRLINTEKGVRMANELGYDPTDQTSFPYQKNDPPFSANDLALDPSSIDEAPDLDLNYFFTRLTMEPYFNGAPGYRTMDMALRLFHKVAGDPAYADISFCDLFAACLDTAFIWEVG